VLLPPPQNKKIPIKQELISEAVKPCIKILDQLKQHKCAWPFLEAVDVETFGIPEYHEIIKEPMDFSTIEVNLKSGYYQTPAQFHQDVMKIFNNSYIFNEGT
jgi:bromodomain-containing factor 1